MWAEHQPNMYSDTCPELAPVFSDLVPRRTTGTIPDGSPGLTYAANRLGSTAWTQPCLHHDTTTQSSFDAICAVNTVEESAFRGVA